MAARKVLFAACIAMLLLALAGRYTRTLGRATPPPLVPLGPALDRSPSVVAPPPPERNPARDALHVAGPPLAAESREPAGAPETDSALATPHAEQRPALTPTQQRIFDEMGRLLPRLNDARARMQAALARSPGKPEAGSPPAAFDAYQRARSELNDIERDVTLVIDETLAALGDLVPGSVTTQMDTDGLSKTVRWEVLREAAGGRLQGAPER